MAERNEPGRTQQKKRKPRRSHGPFWLIGLLSAIAVLLVVIIAYFPHSGARPPVRLPKLTYESAPQSQPPAADPATRPKGTSLREPGAIGQSGSSASSAAAYRRPARKGTLIFIIDDVGNDLKELAPFLKVPGPLTLSIMPQRPYTLAAYRMIVAAGMTPMLHQPMEPDNHDSPGAGAIYTTMDRGEIDALLARNLRGMPDVRWVNNHMGSRATRDAATMRDVLSYLAEHHLHFLDSRTTRRTTVPEVARALGLPYYERNSYFLDDKVSKSEIRREIDVGLAVARRDGYAVMIGHVWDRDLAAILIELYPRLVAEGYQIAGINALLEEVHRSAGTGNRKLM